MVPLVRAETVMPGNRELLQHAHAGPWVLVKGLARLLPPGLPTVRHAFVARPTGQEEMERVMTEPLGSSFLPRPSVGLSQ
eukprot:9465555-Alexandrium_andersonii.AAC.1